MRWGRWRALAALGVAAATMTMAACGGADVPEGYTGYDEDGVQVAYPSAWRAEDTTGEDAERVLFAARGPVRGPGYPRLVIQRFADEEPGRPWPNYLRTVRNGVPMNLPDGRVVGEQPVDVEGADQAALLTIRWRQGDTPILLRQLVAAKGTERLGIAVTMPEALADEVDVQPILDSYRLG